MCPEMASESQRRLPRIRPCSLVYYYILSDDKTSSETLINTANGTEQSVQHLRYGMDGWEILFRFPAGREDFPLYKALRPILGPI